jgi:hypothetical protein
VSLPAGGIRVRHGIIGRARHLRRPRLRPATPGSGTSSSASASLAPGSEEGADDTAPPGGFDVVIDTVGGAVLDASYPMTRRGGRLVTLGAPHSSTKVGCGLSSASPSRCGTAGRRSKAPPRRTRRERPCSSSADPQRPPTSRGWPREAGTTKGTANSPKRQRLYSPRGTVGRTARMKQIAGFRLKLSL